MSLTLFSCKKGDGNKAPTQPPGSIQYKVNGNLVVMDDIDLTTGKFVNLAKQLGGGLVSNTRYMLDGQNGPNYIFMFPILTDTLHESSYHYDSASIVGTENAVYFESSFNANAAGIHFSGDHFDVNISSYKNGRVSGTFSATYTPANAPSQLDYNLRGTNIITEGKITDVQVVY